MNWLLPTVPAVAAVAAVAEAAVAVVAVAVVAATVAAAMAVAVLKMNLNQVDVAVDAVATKLHLKTLKNPGNFIRVFYFFH